MVSVNDDYPASMAPSSTVEPAGSQAGELPNGRPIPLPSSVRATHRPLPHEETSAGGLVVDRRLTPRRGALIGRLDRRGQLMWSLPKGHLELGETSEQAAIREVEEETGIQGSILAPLGSINFWFVASGRRIHKTVHHYLMERIGGELSAEDEEVVEVAWVPLEQIASRLAYADERRLLELVPKLLADHD